MEAVGALASIIGVAGAGAKLSIVLFEFASTVGSAGQEIKQIGIEISLFCSVLKQLQSTLTKAKAYRYSLSAIETTQEILNRCQEVFKEIEGIVNGLRKRGGERSPEATQDMIARVKWTFKRSQVQLLRTTLESCKVTLHIMLSTLEFAQRIASRRISTIETQVEDEHEATMTRSLVIAHQCTVDTLQRLEDEEVQQLPTESDPLSPPLTPRPSSIGRVVRAPVGHKPSRSIDKRTFRSPLYAGDSDRKRVSVWINDLIFDKSPLPLGFRRQTWGEAECALFLDQQPYYFLQKWTDQGEHLAHTMAVKLGRLYPNTNEYARDRGSVRDSRPLLASDFEATEPKGISSNEHTPVIHDNHSSGDRLPNIIITEWTAEECAVFVSNLGLRQYKDQFLENEITGEALVSLQHDDLKEMGVTSLKDRLTILKRVYETKVKQDIPIEIGDYVPFLVRLNSPSSQTIPPSTTLSKPSGTSKHQLSGQQMNTDSSSTGSSGMVEIFKSFRVSIEDPCFKVLPAALQKYNISGDPEDYALYIVYSEGERCLGMDEKPLVLFKQLSEEGQKPVFMLRKKPEKVF